MYNGAEFLHEQLRSIAEQIYPNWSLLVSDDGSTDESRDIVERFARDVPQQVQLIDGPCAGAARNFLHLLESAASDVSPRDWIAFSDQDDVWSPEKLELSVAAGAIEGPALVCGPVVNVSDDLVALGQSGGLFRAPSFRNALVQNIAQGNTITLNAAAAKMALDAAPLALNAPLHDWWLYGLITGGGGKVVYTSRPLVFYRQHGRNLIGSNSGWMARIRRIWRYGSGQHRSALDLHLQALQASSSIFSEQNRHALRSFMDLRGAGVWQRVKASFTMPVYCQRRSSTILLWIAILLRRA